MNPREFLAKWKTHLIFVGALFLVLTLNITIAFTAGQTFRAATWKAISEIRPIEYMMFALFWYVCAVHRPKDGWGSTLTTLNLGQSPNQK